MFVDCYTVNIIMINLRNRINEKEIFGIVLPLASRNV